MKYLLPVAKVPDCPPEHQNQLELITDKFGIVELRCPEHGPMLRMRPAGVRLEELEEYRQNMGNPEDE